VRPPALPVSEPAEPLVAHDAPDLARGSTGE
jgi:hypothetical protein